MNYTKEVIDALGKEIYFLQSYIKFYKKENESLTNENDRLTKENEELREQIERMVKEQVLDPVFGEEGK